MKKLLRFFEHSPEINKHDIPEFFYHGTNVSFDKFSLDYKQKNFESSILGIYFTCKKNPPPFGQTASEYADMAVTKHGGKPIIYKCKINYSNPLIINSNGWYSSVSYIDLNKIDIKRWLLNEKHDVLIVYDFEEDEEKYKDFVLVTNNVDSIEIIEKYE